MLDDQVIEYRNVTPEEVLWALREMQVLSWAEYRHTPDSLVDMDTTVSQFRWDLADAEVMSAWDLARMFNVAFGTRIEYSVWHKLLTPMSRRTLHDVCYTIAQVKRVPVVRAARVFGRECQPAGAFLAIRELCHNQGIDTNDLRPSTPLGPFLLAHAGQILTDLRLLAGPRTPCAQIDLVAAQRGFGDWLLRGVALAVLVIALFAAFISCVCAASLGLVAAFLWCVTDRDELVAVRLGDLRDFRELSYVLAGQAPRRNARGGSCVA